MSRYLIVLTHEDERAACIKALQDIDQHGSHFLTHADWGCKAGVHKGWLIAEVDSRKEAMQLLPPQFRREAQIIELNRFTREEIASLVKELEA